MAKVPRRFNLRTISRYLNGCSMRAQFIFDGYSPPIYPHIDEFDAARLLQIVLDLGGTLLRYQPIGYFAYYPSKVFSRSLKSSAPGI